MSATTTPSGAVAKTTPSPATRKNATGPAAKTYEHVSPAIRAQIESTLGFLDSQGITGKKSDVFRFYGVSHSTGYRLLRTPVRPRTEDGHLVNETRGRKSLITSEQIRNMEQVLESEGFTDKGLSWEQLGVEAGVKASAHTMRKFFGTMDYHHCINCQRGWQSPANRAARVEYARNMLERFPSPSDWHAVRFSDELQFQWGPQHKVRIVRKAGERVCHDCTQLQGSNDLDQDEPRVIKDEQRLHCWAAVGYNYKSAMQFYLPPEKHNGKMNLQVYRDQILEPIVGKWLQDGEHFILAEDGGSGHGNARNANIVSQWKQEHALNFFSDCASSPDLSIVEHCWQPPAINTPPLATDPLLSQIPMSLTDPALQSHSAMQPEIEHLHPDLQAPHADNEPNPIPHPGSQTVSQPVRVKWDEQTSRDIIVQGWEAAQQEYINARIESLPQRLRDVLQNEGRMVGY